MSSIVTVVSPCGRNGDVFLAVVYDVTTENAVGKKRSLVRHRYRGVLVPLAVVVEVLVMRLSLAA